MVVYHKVKKLFWNFLKCFISDRSIWIKSFSESIILTKIEINASKKASARMKGGGGAGKRWLNPARFVILAICVMLFVIFFISLSLITKCNIKDDNDDDIKVVMARYGSFITIWFLHHHLLPLVL